MNKVYCFRIHVLQHNFSKISKIIQLEPNDINGWAYSFNEKEANYMNILDNIVTNISYLNKIENLTDKIEFWIYYEYENQCNLEFDPDLLQKLGNIGCTLCISCWNKN